MTITVEMRRADLAEVHRSPSLLQRMLFRATTETRFAVRLPDHRWVDDKTGRLVDAETEAALLDATHPPLEPPS